MKLSFKIKYKSTIMSMNQDTLVINVISYKVGKGSIPRKGMVILFTIMYKPILRPSQSSSEY